MSLRTKPRKRLIGYARVSTQQQDITRQIKVLKRLGCSVIYSDTASGKSMAGRPELALALDDLAYEVFAPVRAAKRARGIIPASAMHAVND
jgi:predicted site-specific integrase-resolvase